MSNRILVTGATGNIGKAVVEQLAAQEAQMKAFVRSPQKAAALQRSGVETVLGDLSQPETVRAALVGVDRLFLLSPMDPRLGEWERQTIEAARQAGAQRIVYLSGRNAHPQSPLLFNRLHGQSEGSLKQSGLEYTILRPDALMQNLFGQARTIATQSALYLPAAAGKTAWVDARDVATVAVHCLLEDGHSGQVYDVTGPEAISAYQMAQKLSLGLGKEVQCIELPLDRYQQGLEAVGMPGWLVNYLVDQARCSASLPNAGVTQVVADVAGKPPIPFDQFVRDFGMAFQSV